MNKKFIIAIDGPAASGKSTTARLVAKEIGYVYVDTGAMYRAVTLAFIENHFDYKSASDEKLKSELSALDIQFKIENDQQLVFLNGFDVSDKIREPQVTSQVAEISQLPQVRQFLVTLQQKMGEPGGIVMDGRDIGTVVFPNADLKFFMVASVDARASRRLKELALKGIDVPFETMKSDINKRDKADFERDISPLKSAHDAIIIDTSNMTIEEQVKVVKQKFLETKVK